MILLSRRVCSIMRLTRCIGISAACSVWRRQHGCSISTVSAHRQSGAARRSSGRRTMQGVSARERLCCTIHRLDAASRSRSSRSVRRRWTCWELTSIRPRNCSDIPTCAICHNTIPTSARNRTTIPVLMFPLYRPIIRRIMARTERQNE